MKRIRGNTRKIKNFLSDDIWNIDLGELSKAKARFVKYLKVVIITIKTFSAQKIGFQAVALSFFSTMSVVPFIAVAVAVTGGFGLSGKLKDLLYHNFENSQQIIDAVLNSAENIISTAQSSLMGLISALLFVWIVIWMMVSVERVFNNVWKVRKSRRLLKRVPFYLAVLLISPFVIMVFFAGSFVYSNALEYIGLDMEALSAFKTLLTWVLFAAVAAFTVVQYLYLETQVFVTRLNAIYGAFAAVPLFMVWINIGWFIILIGAELSYAFQHVDNYNIEV